MPNRYLEQQVFDLLCSNGTGGDLRTFWSVSPGAGNYYFFSRVAEGCLVVRGTANEAPAVTGMCNPSFVDQLWYLTK